MDVINKVFFLRTFIDKFDDKSGTPEAELPIPEPGDLDKARAVDFEVEKAETKKLILELKEVRRKVANITESVADERREPFHGKMEKFLGRAEAQLTKLDQTIEGSVGKFHKCLIFYKFTPKKGKIEDVKPAEFFEFWYLFCVDFKTVWKKEQLKKQVEQMKKEKKLRREKSELLRPEKGKQDGHLKDKIKRRKSRNSFSSFSSEDVKTIKNNEV